MNVLVTGASGFLGKAIISSLIKTKSFTPHAVIRTDFDFESPVCKHYISDLSQEINWSDILLSQNIVIHAAGLAHTPCNNTIKSANKYRKINTLATLNLARQAVDAGVKRFIFISSIKVNGESTQKGHPFTINDDRKPEDDYGRSKSEAEVLLLQLAEETGMEVVIIRPTLIYGPGVKANFAALISYISKGFPLPFGSIRENRRSLVSVNNLVDLIITCINHPNAANKIFLASDDDDLSTVSIVRNIAKALKIPAKLIPIPIFCYYLAGKIFGKEKSINRLIGSLQVDISHTKNTLDWSPPQTVEQGFKETVDAFNMH